MSNRRRASLSSWASLSWRSSYSRILDTLICLQKASKIPSSAASTRALSSLRFSSRESYVVWAYFRDIEVSLHRGMCRVKLRSTFFTSGSAFFNSFSTCLSSSFNPFSRSLHALYKIQSHLRLRKYITRPLIKTYQIIPCDSQRTLQPRNLRHEVLVYVPAGSGLQQIA